MKAGYIYVLVHPSDPDLYKIGITTGKPQTRLAHHNRDLTKHAGRIVKETGQKWELKEYHAVPDPYWAENVFWSATGLADIPYRRGIEVSKMKWDLVQIGLESAKKAGIRPPEPLPDYVYAYTAWMKKRLYGRGISLLGYVTSRSGKANFRCSDGHEWRTRSTYVAEGEGCPECGMGFKEPEEIWKAAKVGYLYLLTHPDKPGFIKVGLSYRTQKLSYEENEWEDWEEHRYRIVEDPVLAEKIIWELLGKPLPHDREPLKIDLKVAEQAFRDLIYQLHHEIALVEKNKETFQSTF